MISCEILLSICVSFHISWSIHVACKLQEFPWSCVSLRFPIFLLNRSPPLLFLFGCYCSIIVRYSSMLSYFSIRIHWVIVDSTLNLDWSQTVAMDASTPDNAVTETRRRVVSFGHASYIFSRSLRWHAHLSFFLKKNRYKFFFFLKKKGKKQIKKWIENKLKSELPINIDVLFVIFVEPTHRKTTNSST